MAGLRHPVSVHATALVQTEAPSTIQSLPTSEGNREGRVVEVGREGVHGQSFPGPHPFLQQTFAFSVRWSDNSNTFVRRSCDEFRRLCVSESGVTLMSYN